MFNGIKLSIVIGLLVAIAPAFADAPVIATGDQAQALYESLPGPASPERCTGACFPGQPCDPTCTSVKQGDTYYCARARHTRTGAIEYVCYQQASDN